MIFGITKIILFFELCNLFRQLSIRCAHAAIAAVCIRCVRLRAAVSDGGFCEDALQTAGHEVLDHAAQEHVEREGQP